MVDISTIPPCQTVLRLHASRANMVAFIWRNAINTYVSIPDIIECGWRIDGGIQWIDEAYPPSIEDILLDDTFGEHVEYGSDCDSEDD